MFGINIECNKKDGYTYPIILKMQRIWNVEESEVGYLIRLPSTI
jgi:hypothetical protein